MASFDRTAYERAVRRYYWTVAITGVSAFALFDLILWLIVLLLKPHQQALRLWAAEAGTWTLFAVPLAFFTIAAIVPGTLLFLVVRRARGNPTLYCPAYGKLIADRWVALKILKGGECLQCKAKLLESLNS